MLFLRGDELVCFYALAKVINEVLVCSESGSKGEGVVLTLSCSVGKRVSNERVLGVCLLRSTANTVAVKKQLFR